VFPHNGTLAKIHNILKALSVPMFACIHSTIIVEHNTTIHTRISYWSKFST